MVTLWPYLPALHYNSLIDCLKARDAYLPTENEMPKIGFVAYSGEYPVAFAFLRLCEGESAMIDGLTTHPLNSSEERHLGTEAVVNATISVAKSLNIKHLIAYSLNETTLARSEALGFVKQPQTIMILNLTRKV